MVDLQRTDFNSFYFGQGVVILKELIFNCWNFGWVGVMILNELFFLTFTILGGCGDRERTDF